MTSRENAVGGCYFELPRRAGDKGSIFSFATPNERSITCGPGSDTLFALRQLQVIHRRGKVSQLGTHQTVWERFVEVDGHREARYFPGSFPDSFVKVESDMPPSIVIRVIGNLDEIEGSQMSFDDIMRDVTTGVATVRQMVQKETTVVEQGMSAQLENVVTDCLVGNPAALRQSILQLLCGGVINSARARRGLIVCSGTGALQTALGAAGDALRTGESQDCSIVNVRPAGSEIFTGVARQIVVQGSPHDAEVFVSKMLDELSGGSQSVPRERSSVAYVLVGGTSACSAELIHAVQKNWPIFIVEESGGYATHLSKLVRSIEKVHPNASIDDVKATLGPAPPQDAEILTKGDVNIVSPGCSVKEFHHSILFSLRGDETLRQAWSHFAQWHHNELLYNRQTRAFQIVILLLGILTMVLTIIQSFLQLLYPNILDTSEDKLSNGEQVVRAFMLGNNLALIVLPILTSLFQAVLFKSDPASKYVTLRRCSQLMLREIYMYRTQTRGYSLSSVNLQRRKLTGGVKASVESDEDEKVESDSDSDRECLDDAWHGPSERNVDVDERLLDSWSDSEGYFSRQDLLFRRIAALSEIVTVEMSDSPMWEYSGDLPPKAITCTGDDGMTQLSPANYVKFRLNAAQQSYVESSKYFRQQFYALTYSMYVFGSVGTMLAAFAVYGTVNDLNLQFWVALTTSVQNALSRFLDYTRVEHLMQEHSKAKEHLNTVSHWWSQLEQPNVETDSQANRDTLVGKVETCITREVEESGSHMKNLVNRMKKAQEQQEYQQELLERQLAVNGFAARTMQLQSLGVGNLSPENIKAALMDPACPVSADIVQTLDRIEEVFESRPLEDDELDRLRMIEEGLSQGSFGDLLCEGIKKGDFIPVDVRNILRDPKLLPRFEEEVGLLTTLSIDRQSLIKLAKVKAEFHSQIASFPLRRLLLTFKKILEELVVNQFERSLASIKVNLYSLVGTRSEAEYLIGELGSVVSSKDWHTQSLDGILACIKDQDLLSSINALGESTIRAMLKRAQRFFAAKSGAPAMLWAVTKFIALVDVDELMSDPQSTLDRATIRECILSDRGFTRKRSKVELLEFLPPAVRQHETVAMQSKTQLMAYFDEIAHGGFEFDMIDCGVQSYLLASNEKEEQLPSFLRTPESKGRFLFSVSEVSHGQLFNASHDVTIRLMAVSPFFTTSFANELRGCEKLRTFVAISRTTASKSFQIDLFRKICGSVVEVDLPSMIPTLHDRVCFVNLISEGLVKPSEAQWETAADALLSLTPRIAQRLQTLGFSQLVSLFETAALQCSSLFGMKFLSRYCCADLRREVVDYPSWTSQQCTRLVRSVLSTPKCITESDNPRGAISDRTVLEIFNTIDVEDDDGLDEEQDRVFFAIQSAQIGGEPMSFALYSLMSLIDQFGLLSDEWEVVTAELEAMATTQFHDISPPLFPETAHYSVSKDDTQKDSIVFQAFLFVYGPFLLFDAVAQKCIFLDLQSVFCRPLHQYLLILAVHRALTSTNGLDVESIGKRFRSVVGEGEFDELFCVIRRMSQDDITELCKAYAEVAHDGSIAAVVALQHAMAPHVSRTSCVHARVAMYSVACKGVCNFEFISQRMFGFDANLFVSVLPADRLRRLCEAIDDEEIASTLCKLPADAVKEMFTFARFLLRLPQEPDAKLQVEDNAQKTLLGQII